MLKIHLSNWVLDFMTPKGISQTPIPNPKQKANTYLKVHKIENFFGSEFEFYTISLLVMLKY